MSEQPPAAQVRDRVSAANTPSSAPAAAAPRADLGWSNITLPSRGILYDGKLPGGVVSMRRMTSGEQGRLQQQGGNALERIEAVVNACSRFPETFKDPKQLLLTDSFFLMLALRTLSFGTSYSFTYRCRFCSSTQQPKIDIQKDLDERPLKDKLAEPVDIPLPDLSQTVQCRFLRVADQDSILKHAKRTKLGTNDAGDPSYQQRLAVTLVSREGVPFDSILQRQDFVSALSARDCLVMEQTIEKLEPGVDLRVQPECSSCGGVNSMTMPFDAEFFRPSLV